MSTPTFESKIVRATTIVDVAKLAGVSTSAVSRTYTPGASVAKATKRKVLDAAQKLGYRPNAIARTLSTRRSRIIAVVVSYLQNQFYPAIIERLSQELQLHGYHVLLFVDGDHGSDSVDIDPLLLEIMQYQVDGIVLASSMLSSALAIDCYAAGIPIVLFNRVSSVHGANTVASDNYAGGRLAAEILINSGAQRMAFVAGLEDSSTNRDREKGFMDVLQERNKRLFGRVLGQYSFEIAANASKDLFAHGVKPDALFVANDHMAFAVLDTLRRDLRLKVPEDVSVVGFDNVCQAGWGGYRLTTIEQNSVQMVQATVKILIEQMQAKTLLPARHVVIPVKAIMRETVRRRAKVG